MPPDVRPLSLIARIAISLHLFHGYCRQRGLAHPEIDRFTSHFWEFISLPRQEGSFNDWSKREPHLTRAGLGDAFSPEFERALKAAGVSPAEFREVLSCTTEVLYCSMYSAADDEGSLRFLSKLATVAVSVGAKWPDLRCFGESLWDDRHGWGNRPSDEAFAEWRRAGRV